MNTFKLTNEHSDILEGTDLTFLMLGHTKLVHNWQLFYKH